MATGFPSSPAHGTRAGATGDAAEGCSSLFSRHPQPGLQRPEELLSAGLRRKDGLERRRSAGGDVCRLGMMEMYEMLRFRSSTGETRQGLGA